MTMQVFSNWMCKDDADDEGFSKSIWYSFDLRVKTVDAKTINSRTIIFARIICLQGSQISVCHKLHIRKAIYLNILASKQVAW